MIDCVDSTRLRTHLDHADPALDAHLDSCDTCAGLLNAVAADAGYARRALALLDPVDGQSTEGVDVDAALAAARARSAASVVPLTPPRRRSQPAARRLVLAAAAVLVVLVVTLTPTGRSALAQALDAFRGERLQAVTVDPEAWGGSVGPEDARALAALGDLDTSGLTEPERVAGVGEAEALAEVAAPNLVATPDRVVALAPGTARLVLAARAGNGVPKHLDGATLVVDVPGAIGAVYGPAGGPPELVIARSGPLVVRAEGAPLEEIRSFLLSREELPADLRAQLSAIDDWRSTIPVPVPLRGPGWKEVEVAGRQAIAFGDDSGLGAFVVRHDDGGVTVVGGRIPVSRALDLAEGA